ncbi:DUF3592 domain-containing protein [Luteolibacter luteus]|uniref:DUF3592 domain-containing protein n=1 Tax=Luteolibacter luteus TaxID=2728835 RepID=A0A858RK54_9BACT|nr:DUF3592 domain-containing protein [Luteolibacter luteus]QJE96433.1 DUF3592 domain-containing protein [Luteolibacter luteus]
MPTAGKSNSGETKGGCGLVGFGIFWTLFSSIFVVAGLWMAWKTFSVHGWRETPCTIERFEIAADPSKNPPFRADLLFHYEVDGTLFSGTKLWANKEGSDEFEDLSEIRERLCQGPEGMMPTHAGSRSECRVNPANPAEAALLPGGQGGIWGGLAFALFGGVFVLIGVALIWGGLGKANTSVSSRSGSGKRQASPAIVGILFLIFGGVGLGLLFGLVVPKAKEWWSMRQWSPVPAQIVWSRVVSKNSDDGTTYAVDMLYQYGFKDRSYLSNRRDLMGGSSSGHAKKQAFVDAHPPGTEIQVFVDPGKPWRAVMNREAGWWGLLGLFPLPFILIGIFGVRGIFKKRSAPAGHPSPSAPSPQSASRLTRTGAVPAMPSGSWVRIGHVPFAGLVFLLIFAGIWNFVVWGPMRNSGIADGFGFLFFLPFALIGLAVAAAVVYSVLSLFGPKFEIQMEDSHLARGDSTPVRWRRSGTVHPSQFALYLVGKEEASYRNGSSTSTATSLFYEQLLFETTVPIAMDQGHVELRIPSDAMPTFHGKSNRLRWFIVLRAVVSRLPDIRGEREITVRVPVKEELS